MLKDGEIRLDKVQVTASGQRLSLAGDVALKGDSVSSQNLVLALGQNKVNVGFTATDLLGKPLSVTSR